MKKRNLSKLAMIGIASGLISSGCQQKTKDNKHDNHANNKSPIQGQMTLDMQKFYSSLSPKAQKEFMELDAQHKMMAIEMTHQSCSGENKCTGMGGCTTPDHNCGGQNNCSGQGGPPIKDPNKAVEVQHHNQMKKN